MALAVAVVQAGAVFGAGALAEALAGAVALTIAGAGAIAIAVAVALTLTIAVAVAVALALAGELPFGVAPLLGVATVAGAAGVIGAALGIIPSNRVRAGLVWAGGFGIYSGFGILASISSEDEAGKMALFHLLFLLILPLANGLFDWLSWWITRILGHRLLLLLNRGESARQRFLTIVIFGILDLAAAVALLLLMAFTLALAFESYNEYAKLLSHTSVLSLRPMVDAAAADPLHQGFWLMAMLFTTLLPTFGHGLMLTGSVLGFCFIPDSQREVLASALATYDTAPNKPAIRRRTAFWIVFGRALNLLVGAVLLVWLVGRIAAFIWLFAEGGLAGVIAQAAYGGIATAEWLGRVVLGN